jgi:hypothetical protein
MNPTTLNSLYIWAGLSLFTLKSGGRAAYMETHLKCGHVVHKEPLMGKSEIKDSILSYNPKLVCIAISHAIFSDGAHKCRSLKILKAGFR